MRKAQEQSEVALVRLHNAMKDLGWNAEIVRLGEETSLRFASSPSAPQYEVFASSYASKRAPHANEEFTGWAIERLIRRDKGLGYMSVIDDRVEIEWPFGSERMHYGPTVQTALCHAVAAALEADRNNPC